MAADAAGIPVISASVVSRFAAAEARLYPMAVTDPAGYERATTLVGLVAGALRADAADVDAVLAGRADLIETLPDVAAAAGVDLGGLPADAVVDAASALRCRELLAAARAESRIARLSDAHADGAEWIVDEASPDEIVSGRYSRVETHVPSGSTLTLSMEASGDHGRPAYAVELEVAGAPGTSSTQRWEYPDREQWEAAAGRLRAELSGSAGDQGAHP
ncbi:MAG TPA: hypothetical protein VLK34_02175 [Nocardioidaceae bacterium]|nr:hypothetical protein [Nocardioidaceae bacterium]